MYIISFFCFYNVDFHSGFLRHCRAISKWVTTTLDSAHREVTLSYLISYIELLDILLKLKNFNGAFSIYDGIKRWKQLTPTRMMSRVPHLRQIYENAETIFSVKGNYKHYRKLLEKCTLPCVPLVDVWLMDIESLTEHEPPFKSGNFINFEKCRLFSSVLAHIRGYQQRYHFTHISCLQKWLSGLVNEVVETVKYRKTMVSSHFVMKWFELVMRFQTLVNQSRKRNLPNMVEEKEVCLLLYLTK
jgi:hypothetical protein